jgi:hypothetical protein
MFLQLVLKLTPFLLNQQTDNTLCEFGAVADEFLDFGSLSPSELHLGKVILLHLVRPYEV